MLKNLVCKISLGVILATSTMGNAMDLGGVKLGVGPKISLGLNKALIGKTGSSSYGLGWGLGVSSMLDLDFMAVELGLQYAQRRFSFKDLGGGSGDFAATLQQFEIPLLAYYKHALVENIALRAGAGAQFDFGMGKVKGDAGSITYNEAGISKSGVSLLLDLGMDYTLTDIGTLTFDLRYAHGLTDRSKSGLFADNFKTRYIEFGAGLLF